MGLIFVHIQKTGGESIRSALKLPLNDINKNLPADELRLIFYALPTFATAPVLYANLAQNVF